MPWEGTPCWNTRMSTDRYGGAVERWASSAGSAGSTAKNVQKGTAAARIVHQGSTTAEGPATRMKPSTGQCDAPTDHDPVTPSISNRSPGSPAAKVTSCERSEPRSGSTRLRIVARRIPRTPPGCCRNAGSKRSRGLGVGTPSDSATAKQLGGGGGIERAE